MNRLAALPLLLVIAGAAACAAPNWKEDQGASESNLSADGPDGKGDDGIGGASSSVAYGPCRASRSSIMNSVSAQRSAAISRGFEWLDADVPFNMAGRRDSYRTDCSGFVSMCMQLGAPGQTTTSFGTSGSGTYRLGSYEDLVPADGLVDAGHHSFIFLGWNDSAHSGMCVLEQSSTKNDMQFRVRLASTLKGDGFFAIRADKFRNDTRFTGQNAGAGTGTDGDNGTGGLEGEDECSASSVSIRDVCVQARTRQGIECGRVTDGCGRRVDCSVLKEFACSDESDTCEANRCQKCQPKAPLDICAAAKTKSGVECGNVPDGCGGIVNCDSVPGFACADGMKCGLVNTNKCSADPNKPKPADPAPSTPDGTETKPSSSEDGDQGDVNEPDDKKSSDNGGTDDSKKTDAAKKKAAASSGCSTSPGSSSSSSNGGLFAGLIALGAVVSRMRRRR